MLNSPSRVSQMVSQYTDGCFMAMQYVGAQDKETVGCYILSIDLFKIIFPNKHTIYVKSRDHEYLPYYATQRLRFCVYTHVFPTSRISNKKVKYSHQPLETINQHGRHVNCKITVTFKFFNTETSFNCPSPYFRQQ